MQKTSKIIYRSLLSCTTCLVPQMANIYNTDSDEPDYRKIYPSEWSKTTDWFSVKPQPPYLQRPDALDPHRQFFCCTPEEERQLYVRCKKKKIARARPDHPVLKLADWPPRDLVIMPCDAQEAADVEHLPYEELVKKYSYWANMPYNAFIKKRLIKQPIQQWDMDKDKNKSHEAILSNMRHVPIFDKRGNPRLSKEPHLHSDGFHLVHPHWYHHPK